MKRNKEYTFLLKDCKSTQIITDEELKEIKINEINRKKKELDIEFDPEGCKFCKYECKNEDETVHIDYIGGEPELFVVADDPYCGNSVEINYCPFCGRRLREKLLEDLYTKY